MIAITRRRKTRSFVVQGKFYAVCTATRESHQYLIARYALLYHDEQSENRTSPIIFSFAIYIAVLLSTIVPRLRAKREYLFCCLFFFFFIPKNVLAAVKRIDADEWNCGGGGVTVECKRVLLLLLSNRYTVRVLLVRNKRESTIFRSRIPWKSSLIFFKRDKRFENQFDLAHVLYHRFSNQSTDNEIVVWIFLFLILLLFCPFHRSAKRINAALTYNISCYL